MRRVLLVNHLLDMGLLVLRVGKLLLLGKLMLLMVLGWCILLDLLSWRRG